MEMGRWGIPKPAAHCSAGGVGTREDRMGRGEKLPSSSLGSPACRGEAPAPLWEENSIP